jgi:peptidoglycan/LPS O-acetylase OafA/YrhL
VAEAKASRFYRPELDGLRFFAFFAVYINHTFLFGVGGHHHRVSDRAANLLGSVGVAGAFGVDLFFVLSAYLITELLLRERLLRGEVDVKAFYVRRILRIWPLYFLFLAFAYALTFFVAGEALSLRHLFAFAFFSGNWIYMARPVGTVAAPLWSVSVEEQFYILWPWAVRRGSPRRVALVALGLIAVGVAVRLGLSLGGIHEPWISKGSLTRVDGIAAGALLAAALKGRLPRLPQLSRAALFLGGLLGLFLIAARFHLFTGPITTLAQTFGWPLVALFCAAIVLSALGADASGLGAVLRSAPLVYLGRISYGLYVFHQVGLLVAERAFPEHAANAKAWAGHFLVGLFVTLLLGALSYRFVEQPFLRLKQRRFTVVSSRPE